MPTLCWNILFSPLSSSNLIVSTSLLLISWESLPSWGEDHLFEATAIVTAGLNSSFQTSSVGIPQIFICLFWVSCIQDRYNEVEKQIHQVQYVFSFWKNAGFIYKATPTLSLLQITSDKALPIRNVWKAFTGLNTQGFLELNTIDFSYHTEPINACWVLML